MRHLGIDVHVTTSVWCLVDAEGAVLERGKVATTAPKLTALVQRLGEDDELLPDFGRPSHRIGTHSHKISST